ncbi:unnamed protein product, partial [Mesorhabditis spiculigera]
DNDSKTRKYGLKIDCFTCRLTVIFQYLVEKDKPLKRFDYMTGTTVDLDDRIKNTITDFLDRVPANKTATGADRKVYKTYKMCLDTETTGFGQLREILKAVGGPPIFWETSPEPERHDSLDGRIAWKLPVQLITQKLLVEELAKVLAEDLGEADTPERAALRAENQLRTDQSPWLFWYYEIDALSNLMLPTWIKAQYPAHELPAKLRISHNKYFEQLDKLVGEYPEEAVEAVIAQLVLNRIHEIGEKYEEIYKDSLASSNAVVNALNTYDKIRILWGLLAPPLYSSTDALEMIYGGVGFTIGHELGHTIDPNSIDRSPPVLIGAEDAEQFEEQVECIQHQYGNQTLPLNTLDDVFRQPGDLTHGETVADNVGLRSSFRAYRKERQRVYGKKEKRLPGLESYTPDQLYFIAAAMFWCGEASDDRLVGALENVHPPGVFRVNEMMKNSNEFARAYKCPLNSPMNPAKKCRVWRHKKRH